MRNLSKKTYYIIGAVVVVLGVFGFFIFKAPAKSALGNAITEQVTQADINKKITATGTIQQSQTVGLNFISSGLKITKVNVAVGDKVKAGDVLAQADTTNLNIQLEQAEAQMNTAKAALDQIKAGPSAADMAAAQAQVARAQSSQVAAQAAYNINPSDATKQASLNSANADLASAQAALAAKQAGPNSYDVQAKQAAYDQAVASFNQSRQNLAGATIVAPWDGVVISQNGKVGDLAGQGSSGGSGSGSGNGGGNSSGSYSGGSSNSASSATASAVSSSNAVVTLQSTSADMQVISAIDETDISSVQVGQDVQVTVDSYPGKVFNGKVAQIAPQAITQSNVTYFNVTISVTNENDMLKTGMNSNVAILVASKKNVLAVPSEAVKEDNNNKKYVMVYDPAAKRPQRVSVDIGIDDGTMAEVKSGLNDGDKVVIGYRATTSQSTQSKGGFSLFGGNRNGGSRSGSGNSGGSSSGGGGFGGGSRGSGN